MVSPLKRQRDAILAKLASQGELAPLADEPAINTDSLHLKLVEFEQDCKTLKSFESIAQRIEHKRSVLIPKYQPLVEAYLEAGESYQNPIFINMIVWQFDIEQLETAIDWCMKAIGMAAPLPEGWKRKSWACVCADQVLDWATKQAEQGQSVEPYFSTVFEKVRNEWQLHEELSCKYFKFAGLLLIRAEDGKPKATSVGDVETLKSSLALLISAHELSAKAQVKTYIDHIERRIRALESGTNL